MTEGLFSLVVGGGASGKSSFAEELACKAAGEGQKIYLATMESESMEAMERIERHRAMRAGNGFVTIEYPGPLECSADATVLLEDLPNLLSRSMFEGGLVNEASTEAIALDVLGAVMTIRGKCKNLVIVSCDIFSGGRDHDELTLRYMEALGRLHCELGRLVHSLAEIVFGTPVWHKGEIYHA